MTQSTQREARKKVTFERTYDADIEDVWDLWTTTEGIESWWGPEGFRVKVHALDLRPGGEFSYAMIATGPQQIAFMKQAGMPLSTDTKVTFTEVVKHQRLGFSHLVDFVPGVAKYTADTLVELKASGGQVKMVVTLDAMHDAQWTQRAVMGMEQQLGKLDQVLAS